MSDNRRMVSCISGDENHLFYVTIGSEADKVCTGQHISMEECPDCVEDRRTQLRRDARSCDCQFIPDAELCQDGCAYLIEANELAEAPDGLIGYIPEFVSA